MQLNIIYTMEISENKYFIKKYLKSIAWAILILYLSLANLNDSEVIKDLLFPYSDKIAHFVVYALFSFFLMVERKITGKDFFSLILPVSYGVLMEVLQYSLTDYRSLEIYDILANTAGALSVWIFYDKIKDLKQH